MVQGVLFSFRVHALACVFDREARRKRQSAFRVWTLNEGQNVAKHMLIGLTVKPETFIIHK